MNADRFFNLHNKYAASIFRPCQKIFIRGEGVRLWDQNGCEYLDFFACNSTLNQGHRHPKIIEAAKKQLDKLTLTTRTFLNEEIPLFLKQLCRTSGLEQAIPMNSGTEAIEEAIKVARKWGYLRKGIQRGKAEIIVMSKNFHGHTVTTISLSGEMRMKYGFEPLTPGFVHVSFGDIRAFEKAITRNTAGIILEPIQTFNGIRVPPEGYLQELRALANRYEMLLILDEIQTGLGRTGKMFAWQWEDAKPDILCLGSALGGGIYPVSAVLSRKAIFSVLDLGDHGSTLAGNPLASAVASASLRVIEEENLAVQARAAGHYLLEELSRLKHPDIMCIRGKGLLLDLFLNAEAAPYTEKLLDLGIIASTADGNILRLTPPLIIGEKELAFTLARIALLFS